MKKTDKLFVIQSESEDCTFFHKDGVYETRGQAEEALKELRKKEKYGAHLKVETLKEALSDISYTYY